MFCIININKNLCFKSVKFASKLITLNRKFKDGSKKSPTYGNS